MLPANFPYNTGLEAEQLTLPLLSAWMEPGLVPFPLINTLVLVLLRVTAGQPSRSSSTRATAASLDVLLVMRATDRTVVPMSAPPAILHGGADAGGDAPAVGHPTPRFSVSCTMTAI
jgi:hypothetical protein